MQQARALWLILVVFSFSALAESIGDADAALMRGEYDSAVETLGALAGGGDAVAMVRLASLYQRGEGVTQDIEKAVDLYLSAAEIGNADAQYNLGNMYLLGEGVDEDEAWAATFYRLAAKQGHLLASANLNELIRAGVAVDPEGGLKEQAVPPSSVESADPDPTIATSTIRSPGSNASVDPSPADQNSESDDPNSEADIVSADAIKDIGQPAMTKDQAGIELTHDEFIAATVVPDPVADKIQRGSESENVLELTPALEVEQDSLEDETGAVLPNASANGVNLDDQEIAESRVGEDSFVAALASTESSARADDPLINLEPIVPLTETPVYSSDEVQAIKIAEQHGITVNIDGRPASVKRSRSKNDDAARREYAEQAARFEQAQHLLAESQNDRGVALLEELATDGFAAAAAELSDRSESGDGLVKSATDAFKWRQRAAELGDAQAQFQLGDQYMGGDGVDPDDAMAITFYRDAARGGHALAKEKLQSIYADAGLPLPDFSRPRAPIPIYPNAAGVSVQASIIDDVGDTNHGNQSIGIETTHQLSERDGGAAPSELKSPMTRTPITSVAGQEHTEAGQVIAEDDGMDPVSLALQPTIESSVDTLVVATPIAGDPVVETERSPINLVDRDVASLQEEPHDVIVVAAPPSADEVIRPADIVVAQATIPQLAKSPVVIVTDPPPGERIVADRTIEIEPAKPTNHEVIPGSVLATKDAPLPLVYEGEGLIIQTEQPNQLEGANLELSDEHQDAEPVVPEGVDIEPLLGGEPSTIEATARQPIVESVPSTIEVDQIAPVLAANKLDQESDVVALANAEPQNKGFLGRMKNLFSPDPGESLASSIGFKSGAAATTINQMRGAGLTTAAALARTAATVESKTDPRSTDTPRPNEGEKLIVMQMDSPTEASIDEPIMEMPEQLPHITGGTIQDAKMALAERRFAQAVTLFEALAETGDAEAQAHLGYMHYQGEGLPKNLELAAQWYRRAAVQGNRDAQYNLAVAYAFGEGVPQDDVEAVSWYRRAAERGSAIAQYSLGVSYALGEGVARDDVEAIRWYRAAAEQGYAEAQYNLGYGYRSGHGTEVDNVQALEWFLAAASNGHASAQYSLGYMYRSGRGVERDVNEAVKWYRMAAAQGHLDARADLASLNAGTL